MNSSRLLTAALLLAIGAPVWAAQADQAVRDGVAASGHASASAAHSVAASGQVTSAASAVPMALSGVGAVVAGTASVGSAGASARAARGPLPIGDEAVTAMPPPDEALKPKAQPDAEHKI